ncbi:BrnT family toxin [Nostoc sp. FACHB-87]|uniref:BrnT family toxin n=1 Tax=Nostocaceae TaxID=1162 RepID=UPI001686A4C5|nr:MULTISPECIES: BrnT family toxin [Nostocaceae]MBD2453238.1 BrnT family toxin [Nostoc sp. FACHB-87]MBD2474982.1 BrnT family toxin [Anabaena sp. FACHB-83]
MGSRIFDWDENKNLSNIEKHGLNFNEASQAFDDPYTVTILDERKDYGESRFLNCGQITLLSSGQSIIIVVVYTVRDDVFRIISARKANTEEREWYGTTKKIRSRYARRRKV